MGINVSAKANYFSGLYLDAAEADRHDRNKAFIIGGLVFTGQHQRARLLYKQVSKTLTQDEQTIANFHMGVSHVRTSEYVMANKYFIGNLQALRKRQYKAKPIAAFFTYQGLAFYRYFFSRHKKSQKWADLGYAELLKDHKTPPLLLALSLDIQGHNLIQLGRIHLGLKLLTKALNICKKHDLKNLGSDIEVSIYIYRSEFNDDPKIQIANLKELYKKHESSNDYALSALVLQVGKLLIILGQFKEANEFITANYEVIYKNENKRNIAILNTLISQLLYKKGQFLEALAVAKIARQNLNELIDISLILPILALEIKILKLMHKDTSPLIKYSDALAQKSDRLLNLKIFNRIKNLATPALIGEDKLGDLVDRLHTHDTDALEYIFKHEILGLLTSYFKIPPGSKTILILEDKKHLVLFDTEGISQSSKLTRTQILCLKHLHNQVCSKEFLIAKIWGYEYDSLRHDSLIYTIIARLKKILGAKKYWLLSEENGYFFREDVHILFTSTKNLKATSKVNILSDDTDLKFTSKKNQLKTINSSSKDLRNKEIILTQGEAKEGLNYRQIEILANPPENPLSVSDYSQLWQVTRMTALRDLAAMCAKGLAIKTGQGKATRYYIQV